MSANELLSLSQLIGTGLQSERCKIELARLSGEGFFWPMKGQSQHAGVWCRHADWQVLVENYSGLPEPSDLPDELLACVSAVLFEPAGDWLGELLEVTPISKVLPDDIYPLMTFDGVECALLNIPVHLYQDMISQWSPFRGQEPLVELSLIAGYIEQSSAEIKRVQVSEGQWLKGDVKPEQGQSLLWWDRPIAVVSLDDIDENGIIIEQVSHKLEFMYPPVVAKLASIKLSLAQIGSMMEGDRLSGDIKMYSQAQLAHGADVIAIGKLLRGRGGLLVQIEDYLN
ncbi:hypothetical protein [uncultured Shewanella sp.]|uniref:hypothetical protein n=1 Tax=uncultured Shewanella sp. TaxID=173975 RepID=UPI002630F0CA|nr:hypothetical protein [uncultured Shewanella sp.]